MTTETIDRFESSLGAVDVDTTRVDAAELATTIDNLAKTPAVGVQLGIEGVSLNETVVETALTPHRLETAQTGVTPVASGIAEHGTFVLRTDSHGIEPVSLYPPTHVGVVRASDLHADYETGFGWLAEEFRAGHDTAILATGASSTADMGELVHGVHGPQDVHAIVVEDR